MILCYMKYYLVQRVANSNRANESVEQIVLMRWKVFQRFSNLILKCKTSEALKLLNCVFSKSLFKGMLPAMVTINTPPK